MIRRTTNWALALLLVSVPALNVAGQLTPVTPPQVPPALALKDLHGKDRVLNEFHGQVLLINFWASWCSPCVTEMPSLQRLSDQFAGRSFRLLTVNHQESRSKVLKFAHLVKLRLTTLLDADGEAFRAWGGTVLPLSLVLDKQGRIRYRLDGPLEWDDPEVLAQIAALIAE